jgi:hypothetical protein
LTLETGQYVLVIVTDASDAYHNSIRVTTHDTLEDLMDDASGFVGIDLEPDADELDEDQRAIHEDIAAGWHQKDYRRFMTGMDAYCEMFSFRWTCYHRDLGGGEEMFMNLKWTA